MTNILLIIVVLIAVGYGIYWAYPKLPPPGGVILVIVVAVAAVLALLSLAGLVPGGFRLS